MSDILSVIKCLIFCICYPMAEVSDQGTIYRVKCLNVCCGSFLYKRPGESIMFLHSYQLQIITRHNTISLLLDLVTLNLLYVLVFSYLFYPADFPLSSSLNIETSHITRIIHKKLRCPEHVISRVRWVF